MELVSSRNNWSKSNLEILEIIAQTPDQISF